MILSDTRSGLYWAITAIGSSLLLVAAPFIVHHSSDNWRLNYWFWLAFSCAALVLAVLFLPETLFPREPAMLEGNVVATDAYGHVRIFPDVESAEKAGLTVPPSTTEKSPSSTKPYSFLTSLSPYHQPSQSPLGTFIHAYADLCISFLTPAVVWTLLVNAVLFGGLVALSLTYAAKLAAPPWLFRDATVGTVQVGAAIGAASSFL